MMGSDFDFAALAELDGKIRDEILAELTNKTVAEGVRDLESKGAVSFLEDLEPEDQAEILEALPPADRVQWLSTLAGQVLYLFPEPCNGKDIQQDCLMPGTRSGIDRFPLSAFSWQAVNLYRRKQW